LILSKRSDGKKRCAVPLLHFLFLILPLYYLLDWVSTQLNGYQISEMKVDELGFTDYRPTMMLRHLSKPTTWQVIEAELG
jgi:hypothetical protein